MIFMILDPSVREDADTSPAKLGRRAGRVSSTTNKVTGSQALCVTFQRSMRRSAIEMTPKNNAEKVEPTTMVA